MTPGTRIQQRRAVSPVMVGFVGMIIIPLCIVLATNAWSTPDAAAHVRMTFGTIVASTVAVVAAWWLAFNRMRAGSSDRYWFWGVAGIFTLSSITYLNGAAERLAQLITL